MSCIYEKDIYNFLDNKLSTKRKQHFYNHLDTCESCSEKLKNIELIKNALKEITSDDVFESSKDKIIAEVKKEKRNYSILSRLYRFRKPIYSAAALLIIFFMVFCFKPLINIIQYKITYHSVSENIKAGNGYIKIPDIKGNNIDIKKLYPSYIPPGIKLNMRHALGKYVNLVFDNTSMFKPSDKSITIDVSIKKPDAWKEQYNGQDIRNADGEWLFTVETYQIREGTRANSRLSCILNGNIYITIYGTNYSKDDVLRCLLSLKMTDKKLENNINRQYVAETLGPRLIGFGHMTISDCIEVLNDYGIKYKVEGASPSEYNAIKFKDFNIDDNLVVTLYAEK